MSAKQAAGQALIPPNKDLEIMLELAAMSGAKLTTSDISSPFFATRYRMQLDSVAGRYSIYFDKNGQFLEAEGGNPYSRFYRRQIAYLRESKCEVRFALVSEVLSRNNVPLAVQQPLIDKTIF